MYTYEDEFIIKEMNLPDNKTISREMDYYYRVIIPPSCCLKNLNINDIYSRKVQRHFEGFSEYPQNLFFFTKENLYFFGRKTISTQHMQGQIKELHCTQIQSHMIVGVVCEEQLSEEGILIFYRPIRSGEKLYLFDQLLHDRKCNIVYKYVYLSSTEKKERHSSKAGWNLNPLRAKNLSAGEKVLRNYTIQFLSQFSLKGKTIYDPACSTGTFLDTIQKAYPACCVIGQDLSKPMVEFAKKCIDPVYHLDSLYAPIPGRFSDFVFIRFLNSEVVTRAEAKELYLRILPRCKIGGYIIVFGHTPVLLSIYDLENDAVNLLQTTAVDLASQSIFQYYVLQVQSDLDT
ncbi:class I SAM-dependent methyltransferase [Candidatus Cardinium hertigii]|uniref:class I SAM-dependent methyltransferase n=1 Tax=Candidatus Cardinium hertigii TaxID=247481 RepID=UPI003D7D1374